VYHRLLGVISTLPSHNIIQHCSTLSTKPKSPPLDTSTLHQLQFLACPSFVILLDSHPLCCICKPPTQRIITVYGNIIPALLLLGTVKLGLGIPVLNEQLKQRDYDLLGPP
jgi:hypothetical protein